MSIRLGFSPMRHARISTNYRGNVRLGVGAHHGPWSITTGKTLIDSRRPSRGRSKYAKAEAAANDEYAAIVLTYLDRIDAAHDLIRARDARRAAEADLKIAEQKLALFRKSRQL